MKKILLLSFAFVLSSLSSFIFFDLYQISGNSMSPTLQNGQWVVAINCKLSFVDCNFYTNDIVVFKIFKKTYLKRIAQGPGNAIKYYKGEIELELNSSKVLVELENWHYKHLNNAFDSTIPTSFMIPSGKFFVLGDNLSNSNDSRSFGFIDRDEVLGKVILF